MMSLGYRAPLLARLGSARSSGNSDSVRGCTAPSSSTSIERRHANSCVSLISPRYSTCRGTTRPGDARVLDNAPVAVLLAILPANFAAQDMMAADYRHIGGLENRRGRHY